MFDVARNLRHQRAHGSLKVCNADAFRQGERTVQQHRAIAPLGVHRHEAQTDLCAGTPADKLRAVITAMVQQIAEVPRMHVDPAGVRIEGLRQRRYATRLPADDAEVPRQPTRQRHPEVDRHAIGVRQHQRGLVAIATMKAT